MNATEKGTLSDFRIDCVCHSEGFLALRNLLWECKDEKRRENPNRAIKKAIKDLVWLMEDRKINMEEAGKVFERVWLPIKKDGAQ